MQIRELTRKEKQTIRHMVNMCANYDIEYGCLLLDGDCFMFGKIFTNNILCKWFRNALLPTNPQLERLFTGRIAPDMKPCALCKKQFKLNRRQIYCSKKCNKTGRKKAVAKNVKAYRQRKRDICNHLSTVNPYGSLAECSQREEVSQ